VVRRDSSKRGGFCWRAADVVECISSELAAGFIDSADDGCRHFQAARCERGGDQVAYRLYRLQDHAAVAAVDVREHSMFDGVVLRLVRRAVRDLHRLTGEVRNALQLDLKGSYAIAVAATAVAEQQHFAGSLRPCVRHHSSRLSMASWLVS
jgi:hypothetical protein